MGNSMDSSVRSAPPVLHRGLDDSIGSQKPSAIVKAAIPSPELVKSQQASLSERALPAERDAILLMKECYRLSGNDISETLNDCINELVDKMEAGQAGSERGDKLKRRIIDVIKNEPPVASSTPKAAKDAKPDSSSSRPYATPVVETVEDDNGSVFTEVISQAPSSSSKTPHPIANNTASATAKKPAIPRSISFNTNTSFENELRQVAQKTSVLDKLVKHKEELDKTKANSSPEQKKQDAIKAIEALVDMDSFNTALDAVKSRVDEIAKATSTEKASVVSLVRQTELQNRREISVLKSNKPVAEGFATAGKSGVVKAATMWQANTAFSNVVRENASGAFQKIQLKINASQQKVAEPNKPEIELNMAKLNALAERLPEVEKLEKERLSKLEEELDKAREGSDNKKTETLESQVDKCRENTKKKKIKAHKDLITSLRRAVSAADTDVKLINNLAEKLSVKTDSKSKANRLPFSLPILANGAESPIVKSGFGLNNALEYLVVGKGNHAMSRSLALRINLNEFGSDFNIFDNRGNDRPVVLNGAKRSFLATLDGALGEPNNKRSEKIFQFFGEAQSADTKQCGRVFIHKLAACNVSAAGFNPQTLQLDAPSLAFKVETGFGPTKKFIPGRAGVYARNPAEHLGSRLQVLGNISSNLQAEVFKNGAPVDWQASIITPQNAVEASSLIVAALPNDLLTTNHEEVTTFMKLSREFEREVDAAQQNNEVFYSEKLSLFKVKLNAFHEKAASWVANREEEGGAGKSVAAAHEISRDIANSRKGFFRSAPVALGNFINLAGGRAIRESVSAIRNYVSTVNQKERLRQQFVRPENSAIVSGLKRQLLQLTKSTNEAQANNARALITYLEGKSLGVKLEGQLSPKLTESLLDVGNFLQRAWEPRSNGKPAPKVIGLTSIQTNSIKNYASTNLARFAADATVPVRAAASTSAPASAVTVAPKVLSRSASAPVLTSAPTLAPKSASASVQAKPNNQPQAKEQNSVKPSVAAAATVDDGATQSAQPGDQWTVEIWRDFLSTDPERRLKYLMEQYVEDVFSANPLSQDLSPEKPKEVEHTREELIDTRRSELTYIIDYLNKFEPGVVDPKHPGLQKMRELAVFF